MAKKTIKVVNQSIQENAMVVINGNTVNLDYNYIQGQTPETVNFSVFTGEQGTSEFTGVQTSGGSLSKNGSFSTYNLGERQVGAGALFDEVYNYCNQILKGTITKETPTNETTK